MQCISWCALFDSTWESSEHLFLHCNYASFVWDGLQSKLILQPIRCFSILNLASSMVDRVGQTGASLILIARLIFPAFAWHIWRERNSQVFSHKFKRPAQVLYDVLQQIYSRDLFLDIQLPDPYQGLWNLPSAMGLWPHPCIPFVVHEGWRFSIVLLQTYLIGILWQPNGHPGFAAIRRDILFYQEVTYLIEMVPLYISELCVEMEVSLSKTLLDPSKSPWTHRFE